MPRDLPYDGYCTTPRYQVFRNYIDIYKTFKTLKFRIKSEGIDLEGGSDFSTQVNTHFDDVITSNEQEGELEQQICAIVDSRRLSGIFHSIHVLSLLNPNIICRIKHSKYLIIDFNNGDETIFYKFVMENLEEIVDDGNEEIFEKCRQDASLFD